MFANLPPVLLSKPSIILPRTRPITRGFSLLEVVMTLTVLSAATYAAVTASGTPMMNGARAKQAASELASLLRTARNTAITKQRPVEIRIAGVEDLRWVETLNTGGGLPPTQPIVIPLTVPAGVTMTGWPGVVQFNALGVANTGLDTNIAYDGRVYRLRMYQASGIIRVNRP